MDLTEKAKNYSKVIKMEIYADNRFRLYLLDCDRIILAKPYGSGRKEASYLGGPWLDYFMKKSNCSHNNFQMKVEPKNGKIVLGSITFSLSNPVHFIRPDGRLRKKETVQIVPNEMSRIEIGAVIEFWKTRRNSSSILLALKDQPKSFVYFYKCGFELKHLELSGKNHIFLNENLVCLTELMFNIDCNGDKHQGSLNFMVITPKDTQGSLVFEVVPFKEDNTKKLAKAFLIVFLSIFIMVSLGVFIWSLTVYLKSRKSTKPQYENVRFRSKRCQLEMRKIRKNPGIRRTSRTRIYGKYKPVDRLPTISESNEASINEEEIEMQEIRHENPPVKHTYINVHDYENIGWKKKVRFDPFPAGSSA